MVVSLGFMYGSLSTVWLRLQLEISNLDSATASELWPTALYDQAMNTPICFIVSNFAQTTTAA